MKNKINLLLVLAVMIFVIGCSCGNMGNMFSDSKDNGKSSDKTLTEKVTDKVTDVATEGEKIGVPECDELMDYFRNKIDDEKTDFVTKAFLKTLESQFRAGIKKNIEENKTNKEDMAKWCKEFKSNIDKEEAKTK